MEVIIIESTKSETPVTADLEVIDEINSDKEYEPSQTPIFDVEKEMKNNGAMNFTENSNMTDDKCEEVNRSAVSVVEISEMSARKPPPSYAMYDHRRMSNENLSNLFSLLDVSLGWSPSIVSERRNSAVKVITNYHTSGPQRGLTTPTVHVGDEADPIPTRLLSISCDSEPETECSDFNRGSPSPFLSADLSPNSVRSLLPAIAESSFESDDRETPIATATQAQDCSSSECKTNVKEKLQLVSNMVAESPKVQENTAKSKAQEVEVRSSAAINSEVRALKTPREDVNIENSSPLFIIHNTCHKPTNDTTTDNFISVDNTTDHHECDGQIAPSKFNAVADSKEYQTKEEENPSHIILDRKPSHTTMTCILHIDNSTTVKPNELSTSSSEVNNESHLEDNLDINDGESNFKPLVSNMVVESPKVQENTAKSKAQEVEVRSSAARNSEAQVLKTLREDVNIENNSPLIITHNTCHEPTSDTITDSCISVDNSKDRNECVGQIAPPKCNAVADSKESQTKEEENPSQITLERKPSNTTMPYILHIDNYTMVKPKELSTSSSEVNNESHLEDNEDINDGESNFKPLVSNMLAELPKVQENTAKLTAQDVEVRSSAARNSEVQALKTLREDVNIENNSPIIITHNTCHEPTNDTTMADSKEYQTKEEENPSHIILDRKPSHTTMTCILHIDNSTTVKPKELFTSSSEVNNESHLEDNADINDGKSNFTQLKMESKHNDTSSNKNARKTTTENNVVIVTGSVLPLQDLQSFETVAKSHVEVCDNNSESAKENVEKLLDQNEDEVVNGNTMLQPVQKCNANTPNESRYQDVIYIVGSTSDNGITVTSMAERKITDKNRDITVITATPITINTTKNQHIDSNILEKFVTTSKQKSCGENYNKNIHDCEKSNTCNVYTNRGNMAVVLKSPITNEITVPGTEVIAEEKSVDPLERNLAESGHFSSEVKVLSAPEDNAATRNDLNSRNHFFRRHSIPSIDTEPFMQEPNAHFKNNTCVNNKHTEVTCSFSENLKMNKEDELSRPSVKHETSNIDTHSTHGVTNLNILNQPPPENVTSPSAILRNNNDKLCIDDSTLLRDENTIIESKEGINSNPNAAVDFPAVSSCKTDVKSQSLLEKCVLKLNLKPFFIKRNKAIKHEAPLPNPEILNKFEVKDITNESSGVTSDKRSNSVKEDSSPKEPGTTLPAVNTNQIDIKNHDYNEILTSVVNTEENNISEQQEIVSEDDHISEEDRQASFLQFSPSIKFGP